MLNMKGAFWNIRGMKKTGRNKCLGEFIRQNNLGIVGIQETKKEAFSAGSLESINKGMDLNYDPAKGTVGGILVGVKVVFF
jgi:exonuclease III